MQSKDSNRPDKSIRKRLEPDRTSEMSIREEIGHLRKALAKAEVILDSLPSDFAIIQSGKVKEITPRGLLRLGYSREEIQGMDFTHLVHTGAQTSLEDGYDRNPGGNGSPEPKEVQLLTKDGGVLSCDLTLYKITYQGRAALLAEMAPSAARRERERSLISANKDDLVANMSSGLVRKLTPSVRALNEYAARMRTRPNGPGRTKAQDRELMTAANELEALTRCLQSLSGEDDGRPRTLPFDLGQVVQEAISHMEGMLNKRARQNAAIHLQCYLRQASPVEGDPEEIRKVVIGLITNAIEAMPEGGDLYITAEENAGYACVYIQDSGTSIAEELLPKVADPFFTTKGRGSDGLGLCLARAVLKKHHGDLHLESGKGSGTTITLRMPLARQGAGQGKLGVKKKKNMWIMIMEEDHLIRELFFQVLSSKGYKVETAETSPECFEKLKNKSFDLVIAGILSGDTQALVRRIRKAAPQTCLALVGEVGDGNRSGRVPRGSVDLLIGKPIDMGWTLNRISEILTGRTK